MQNALGGHLGVSQQVLDLRRQQDADASVSGGFSGCEAEDPVAFQELRVRLQGWGA